MSDLFDKWAKTHRTLWAVYSDRQMVLGRGLEIVSGQTPQFLQGVPSPLDQIELWGFFLENGLGLLDKPVRAFEIHFETRDVPAEKYLMERRDRIFATCIVTVATGTLYGHIVLAGEIANGTAADREG